MSTLLILLLVASQSRGALRARSPEVYQRIRGVIGLPRIGA